MAPRPEASSPPAAGSATEAPTRVAIALGSNLGDRAAALDAAAARLGEFLDRLTISSYRQTAPVDVPSPQPAYLNAACVGLTMLDPRTLLDRLLAIEQGLGRERPYPRAPRTLDVDLILYGDRIVDEPGLTIPHQRFRERAFVLDPLAEIAPDLVDPVTGETVAALRERVHAGQRESGSRHTDG